MKNLNEKETDPEGLPIDRQMKQRDEVEVTSPSPLSGEPASYLVGGNDVKEYVYPALNLPEQISAKEIYLDDSNPDGCISARQR